MAARQAIHVPCHLKYSQLKGEREEAGGGGVFVFVCIRDNNVCAHTQSHTHTHAHMVIYNALEFKHTLLCTCSE